MLQWFTLPAEHNQAPPFSHCILSTYGSVYMNDTWFALQAAKTFGKNVFEFDTISLWTVQHATTRGNFK